MKQYLPILLLFLLACQSNETTSNSNPATNLSAPKSIVQLEKEKKPSTKKLAIPDTAYVNAKSGLRVRSQPSLEGERIGVRPYGKKVLITERTGKTMTIQDEGKEINGEWVGIESRLVSKGKVEKVTGYIFSGFLVKKQPTNHGVILANLNSNYSQQGIGGILMDLENLPIEKQKYFIRGKDTLQLYGDDLKTVHTIAAHQFLTSGNRRFIKGDFTNCLHSKPRIRFSHDLGLGNFVLVKEIKKGFAFLGNFCGKNIWIKLAELDTDFVSFKSYAEIFESKPIGGAWEHGYTYTGPNKVLRAQPSLSAKSILNTIPPDYEIHIVGPVKGNWAKVKIKEAKHEFGEMYYRKSIYGKTWEGWIMITEPDGAPLMQPHIFGC